MPDIQWLDVAVVVGLHEQTMRALGDQPQPVRDMGGLEAAIMRPQMRAHYEGTDDIVALAALLGAGISQAQAFLDGNKRTALAAISIFLDLNGWRLTATHLDTAKQLEAIAEAPDRDAATDAATDAFADWLKDNAARRSTATG